MIDYDSSDLQLRFIENELPAVIQYEIQFGDEDIFFEALGYDGLDYAAQTTTREWSKESATAELRKAVANEDHERVGQLICAQVNCYFEEICYDKIANDLGAYGYE